MFYFKLPIKIEGKWVVQQIYSNGKTRSHKFYTEEQANHFYKSNKSKTTGMLKK